MIFSESNSKIAPALAKAWAEIENPKHNATVKVKSKKTNTEYTFDYTDLGGIFDEAKRVFKDNGISILQNAHTEILDGNLLISVETMFLHTSGEWVKSQPLRMPSNPNIQDMGGQVTYMKRYSLSAMLGIATEKDDDANGASGNDYQLDQKKASEKTLNLVNKLLTEKANNSNGKYTPEQLYALLKQKRLKTDKEMEDWTQSEASKAIQFLQGASA